MKITNFIIAFLIFLVVQGKDGAIDRADGAAAGVCGKNMEAVVYKLAPCAAAAQSENVLVPCVCCDQLKKIDKCCLCAIILSKEAKILGLKPQVAVTIPKSCKFANRPMGYKCGGLYRF